MQIQPRVQMLVKVIFTKPHAIQANMDHKVLAEMDPKLKSSFIIKCYRLCS